MTLLVRLDHETDLAGFRREARALLARRVAPEQVHWSAGRCHDDLFAVAEPADDQPPADTGVNVPPAFLELCHTLVLHREPHRFALLYRLLWRLLHEPNLRHDPLDADMVQARHMAQAVRRDIHKMHAFVRFRQVQDTDNPLDPLHVAWFEPDHHIVEANAPWFRRRFANMRWAILTPERCVEWDRQQLHFRAGADHSDAPPADAGEQLWLTYYQGIFNPARLKLKMMQKEMPRKYWRNLPEASLIGELAARAQERSGTMIEQPATVPLRRIPAAPRRLPAVAASGSLPQLHAATDRCRDCPIGALATQAVPGEGPLYPALMFVGEQPGDQEDLRGRPFVGPAGQLFERALAQAGLDRQAVFVSNAVRHFKYELRGKRRIHKTPTQHEADACRHWLEEEIALVQPRALVALGATAARALLGRPMAVMSERGQWFARGDGLRVLVTVHPSALLRLPPEQLPAAFERFAGELTLAAVPDR
ncbi:MAG: uracil-DNA glycosylase protein-like protein [Ramlibacter sp.]|uniref:UdgX family uracil-DNA binding protein n=1 Tax=Ramlibacter sp. TaxID=1917967 RepID=UPI00262A68B2|nr:UdgX family uracil-DNA binding protein [Ramlibacter sp.]MDB5751748.1 uracil-DNA glycosylase protein-like protein [Ramlibacter sp.]